MIHFITTKNVINCIPVLFHVTHQKGTKNDKEEPSKNTTADNICCGFSVLVVIVGNSRNEEFKGCVPTMEPLIDLPMPDILLFTMFVKMSLQTTVLCESPT